MNQKTVSIPRRIGVAIPYFPRVSGGVKYTLVFLRELQRAFPNAEITVLVKRKSGTYDLQQDLKRICGMFGIPTPEVPVRAVLADSTGALRGFLRNYLVSRKFDLFVNGGTKSFFPNGAKTGIYINHFPPSVPTRRRFPVVGDLAAAWKAWWFPRSWHYYASNGEYSQGWLTRYWHIPAAKQRLLYPPVVARASIFDVPPPKKDYILSTGRISDEKQQHILLSCFLEFRQERFPQATLVLAGPSPRDGAEKAYVDAMRRIAEGHPVEFRFDLPQEDLWRLYGESKVYWHARGYGVDQERTPFQVEHFGMTTVEAMACGVVPVVIARGGQTTIVQHDVSGFLWETIQELAEGTARALDEAHRGRLAEGALIRSRLYTEESFQDTVGNLLSGRFQGPRSGRSD